VLTYQVNRQYKYVKDQFEVLPQNGLLVKEGFVPVPKGFNVDNIEMSDIERKEDDSSLV
jgi:hypothetical protein